MCQATTLPLQESQHSRGSFASSLSSSSRHLKLKMPVKMGKVQHKMGKVQKRLLKFIRTRRNRSHDSKSDAETVISGIRVTAATDEDHNVHHPYRTTRSVTAKETQFEMIAAVTNKDESRDDVENYRNEPYSGVTTRNNFDSDIPEERSDSNAFDASIAGCVDFYMNDDDAWKPLDAICNFLLFNCCGKETVNLQDDQQLRQRQEHPQIHEDHDEAQLYHCNGFDKFDQTCAYPDSSFNGGVNYQQAGNERNIHKMMRAVTYRTCNR